MDIFEPTKRSEIMSKIKGKNTKPERVVYSYLRGQKVYFQKHYKTKEKISIDIALPRKKKAVFIDGDFWHGATVGKILERRGPDDFWTKKINRNIERDKQQMVILKENGWRLLRIWESEVIKIKSREAVLRKIKKFLSN